MDFHIRWMIRRDMPEVLLIECSSFDLPWEETDFIKTLRQCNCIGIVIERGTDVVGYVLYELNKTSLTILNFAVHPNHRLQGAGTALINKLKSKLTEQRRNQLKLIISEKNLGGQLFFKTQSLYADKVIRNHWREGKECDWMDAYEMSYHWNPDDYGVPEKKTRVMVNE